MQEKYHSPAEVAEILGVTRETIYNVIKSGDLKSYKIGRLRRISTSQIQDALSTSDTLLSDNKSFKISHKIGNS
jgi:excisionase family DNA binding protein